MTQSYITSLYFGLRWSSHCTPLDQQRLDLIPAGSQGSSPEIQLSSPSPMSQQARKETQLLKMKLLGWSHECICPCLLPVLAWQITSWSSSRQNIWWERHLDGGWCDVSNKIYKEKYKTRMSDLPGCHGVMSSWMCLGKVCTWRAVKRDGGECISSKGYSTGHRVE